MIMDYNRIRDFILSYCHDDEGILSEMYTYAQENDVPIIRREARDFLKTLLAILKPDRILEIGTAIGYSAIVMAEAANGSVIDTCELDSERIEEARGFIKRAGMESRIIIHEGDAVESLEKMVGSKYDLVFIDAAKAQYGVYMDLVLPLCNEGAVIVCDNILADGDVLESHFLVEKRDRTIHDRMRDFLYSIKNDNRLETAILSVADGMAVSVVVNKES